ncbi:hypothetical protein [Streptomyces sp. NPDC002619]
MPARALPRESGIGAVLRLMGAAVPSGGDAGHTLWCAGSLTGGA